MIISCFLLSASSSVRVTSSSPSSSFFLAMNTFRSPSSRSYLLTSRPSLDVISCARTFSSFSFTSKSVWLVSRPTESSCTRASSSATCLLFCTSSLFRYAKISDCSNSCCASCSLSWRCVSWRSALIFSDSTSLSRVGPSSITWAGSLKTEEKGLRSTSTAFAALAPPFLAPPLALPFFGILDGAFQTGRTAASSEQAAVP
mmetsp:Transcript_22731/g.52411  ORF Transcript_22731/g.52411 Transcript_22731/m.52411 type:complete len:201 (-) Transcript_22731:92-694(-)